MLHATWTARAHKTAYSALMLSLCADGAAIEGADGAGGGRLQLHFTHRYDGIQTNCISYTLIYLQFYAAVSLHSLFAHQIVNSQNCFCFCFCSCFFQCVYTNSLQPKIAFTYTLLLLKYFNVVQCFFFIVVVVVVSKWIFIQTVAIINYNRPSGKRAQ